MNRRSFLSVFPAGFALLSGGEYSVSKRVMINTIQQAGGGTVLRGVTWGKNRGLVPLVATAERFRIMHGITINWDRPYNFANGDLEEISKTYDVLMIDHPHVGSAAQYRYLVPLNDYLSEAYLRDQADNTVGKSHESYQYDGIQWGLATDAATPVASYRPDLLEEKKEKAPKTWDEMAELVKKGLAAFPCDTSSALMNFFMMCDTEGEAPCMTDQFIVGEEMGVKILRQFRELTTHMPAGIYDWGATGTHEYMTQNDTIAYCPFTYPYCNYSRRGFARKLILFTDLVTLGTHGMLHSTLGGAGLAVSAHSRFREVAVDYIRYTTSPEIQRTLYFENGGQPGHRSAWQDDINNNLCNNYFRNTIKSHDAAYLRPRYNGYIYFQRLAGEPMVKYLREGGSEKAVLAEMNRIYRESLDGRK